MEWKTCYLLEILFDLMLLCPQSKAMIMWELSVILDSWVCAGHQSIINRYDAQ